MNDNPNPRMVIALVLPMDFACRVIHSEFLLKAHYTVRKVAIALDWCICQSLQETLLLQIEGHDHTDHWHNQENRILYDACRERIDNYIFQFQPFCIADKLGNPCLPLIYFRKENSVYLVSPEV